MVVQLMGPLVCQSGYHHYHIFLLKSSFIIIIKGSVPNNMLAYSANSSSVAPTYVTIDGRITSIGK